MEVQSTCKMFRNEGQNVANIYKHSRKIRKIILYLIFSQLMHKSGSCIWEKKKKRRKTPKPTVIVLEESKDWWAFPSRRRRRSAASSTQHSPLTRRGAEEGLGGSGLWQGGSHGSPIISSLPCSTFSGPSWHWGDKAAGCDPAIPLPASYFV